MQSRVSKTLKKKGFEIIVGKRGNGGYHFLFFPQCISVLLNRNHHFSYIYFVVCKCLPKFVVWYRFNSILNVDNIRSFCEQCRSRSDCTERLHSSYYCTISLSSNGSVISMYL